MVGGRAFWRRWRGRWAWGGGETGWGRVGMGMGMDREFGGRWSMVDGGKVGPEAIKVWGLVARVRAGCLLGF